MKIAHINENNQLLGWYDNKIHTTIPIPNIEVSDEVWQNAIDNNHNKVNNDGTTELFDFRTSEEIEAQRVSSIKSKAGQLIGEKYPTYKQLNIVRVDGVELETMSNYIDKIRSISNEAEKNGTKLEDINWQI